MFKDKFFHTLACLQSLHAIRFRFRAGWVTGSALGGDTALPFPAGKARAIGRGRVPCWRWGTVLSRWTILGEGGVHDSIFSHIQPGMFGYKILGSSYTDEQVINEKFWADWKLRGSSWLWGLGLGYAHGPWYARATLGRLILTPLNINYPVQRSEYNRHLSAFQFRIQRHTKIPRANPSTRQSCRRWCIRNTTP
jgi:hypothetical protein